MNESQTPTTKRRILVVDDHDAVRHSLRFYLERMGDFEVCGEAADGESALSLLSSSQPDLVLLDLSLGRGDGLSITHSMRAVSPSVPILILSIHSEHLFAERALRAGANGYITKEELADHLLSAIDQIFAGRLYVSESVRNRILQQVRGSTREKPRPVEQLSDRELEIFNLLGQRKTPQQIAQTLNLSIKTVDTHRAHIKKKMGMASNQALLSEASRWLRQAQAV